jgi:hypothetical protein
LNTGLFSYARRKVLSQLIVNKELVLNKVKEKIKVLEQGDEQELKNIGKDLGKNINNYIAEPFSTKNPNIDIRHNTNLSKKPKSSKETYEIPYWGKKDNIIKKENQPKISFIISTYNRPNNLMCLIYSILSQTNPNWELLIMDEGNNTISIEDKRIKRYKVERKEITDGRGSLGLIAKDEGVQYAKGKYLCFLNEDMYVAPKFIEIMTQFNEDIIGCDEIYADLRYNIMKFEPKRRHCNLNFIVKPEVYKTCRYTKFTNTLHIPTIGNADGLAMEEWIKNGASYKRVRRTLITYN